MRFFVKSLIMLTLPAIFCATVPGNSPIKVDSRIAASLKSQRPGISCSVNAFNSFEKGGQSIPWLPGWGDYRMRITARNDSANLYFQQGINLYYGFHIGEAMASFQKSTKLDSSFAMGYWGIALALGPNINYESYTASPKAWVIVNKAKALSGNCTPVEKALIEAMLLRYSKDSVQDRPALDQKYADAMNATYQKFPEYPDAAALYADALMVLHPWTYYDAKGKAKPWTPEIVNVLENLLKKYPKHPGAEHYYIHAVEASAHPERALQAALNLSKMMPGVAHPAHMPSHIFVRTGYYKLGVDVNQQAISGYNNYLAQYSKVANGIGLYLIHNLHMEATCANLDGRFEVGMHAAMECRRTVDSSWLAAPGFDGVTSQYVFMTPLLTLIRFGEWQEILLQDSISTRFVYANLLWHYGKGLAYARMKDLESAKKELSMVHEDMKDDQLQAPAPPFGNPGINGARVAERILAGVIAEEQKDFRTAIGSLQDAVAFEDAMNYDEPRDWVHPARQYFGSVLIRAGQFKEAEKAFREDLVINPKNGWAYAGLWQSLKGQKRKNEAEQARKSMAKAFERADKQINQPVY